MLKRFFITGTDTSVGKTVVSRALLQALASQGKTVAGYKPVAKGSKETPEGLRNKDALVLQSVSTIELPYEAVNPIALSEEESSVAHSCPINYTLISNGLANLTEKVDHVVVEGTGGWRSLMNDLRPLSEWVVQEQLPVLMVVGIQEGCINHALLTAQAIANDGLPLIGWWLTESTQDWRIMRKSLMCWVKNFRHRSLVNCLICRAPNSVNWGNTSA